MCGNSYHLPFPSNFFPNFSKTNIVFLTFEAQTWFPGGVYFEEFSFPSFSSKTRRDEDVTVGCVLANHTGRGASLLPFIKTTVNQQLLQAEDLSPKFVGVAASIPRMYGYVSTGMEQYKTEDEME